jgi:hypothetical protein
MGIGSYCVLSTLNNDDEFFLGFDQSSTKPTKMHIGEELAGRRQET